MLRVLRNMNIISHDAQNAQNHEQHEQVCAQMTQSHEQHKHQNETRVYRVEIQHF